MSGRRRTLALVTTAIALLLTIGACSLPSDDLGPVISPSPDGTPSAPSSGPNEDGGGEGQDGQEPKSSSNEVNVGPAIGLPPGGPPLFFDFGQAPVGSENHELLTTVRNTEAEPLVIDAVEVVGDHQQDFTMETGCAGVELASQETCEIAIVFAPTETGEREAILQISVSGPRSRFLRIVGTGIS
jgi:hypothetical protein